MTNEIGNGLTKDFFQIGDIITHIHSWPWRVVDIGMMHYIVAARVNHEDPSWHMNGPPFAVDVRAFGQDDIDGIVKVERGEQVIWEDE